MGAKLSTKWWKKKQGRNRYDFTRRHRTYVDSYRPILAPRNGPACDFLEVEDELSSSYYDESSDSSSWTTEPEKCYDPLDPTLTFVDGEDELDFLCNDYKSLRAKMSCGHTVTPMSLMDWCYYLLEEEGECTFECGQTDCDAEWPFDEVCKMALLTPDEIAYFENQIFRNGAKKLDIKCCPGCKSRVVRSDIHDLSVECPVCTAERKRPYLFCWQCMNKWKGPAPRSDRCENEDCLNPVGVLKNCPDINFEDVEGVKGCPSIRACPTCGTLVEHNKKECKNVVCPTCKLEFCFVCLKVPEECAELDEDYFGFCSSGVAPRQTSIPVWHGA